MLYQRRPTGSASADLPPIEACRIMLTSFDSRGEDNEERYGPVPPFADGADYLLPDWALEAMRCDMVTLLPETTDAQAPQSLAYCSWITGPYPRDGEAPFRVRVSHGDYLLQLSPGVVVGMPRAGFELHFEPVRQEAEQMPEYVCHKRVHALKIAAVEIREDGRALIAPVDRPFEPFMTRPEWGDTFHGDETDLGYYVVYKDGYTSWSPTEAFEEGYTRV